MTGFPPFPLDPDDRVTFIGRTGFVTGIFRTWDRKGRAVVAVPEYGGRIIRVPRDSLRPCNDAAMVAKRGRVPWRSS